MIMGLVLAAGFSRRFGADKRFVAMSDERPITLAAAMNLKAHVDHVRVVVKTEDEALIALLSSQEIDVIVTEHAHEGMGSTLADAVRAMVQTTPEVENLIVALGDMPFIHPTTYGAIRTALIEGASLVRPRYQGIPGHPVGFRGDWFESLMMLSGDSAARELIASCQDQVTMVDVEDRGSIADIDTPQDLAHWMSASTDQEIL